MTQTCALVIATGLAGMVAGQTPAGFPTDLNSTFTTTGPRNVRVDTGTYVPPPPVEEVHYYYDQWPIGLAVSRTGRIFTCYTRGTYAHTLGEVVNQTAERAYPSQELNTPPGGLVHPAAADSPGVPFASNDQAHFISVQALYVTLDDTLWVLDTGRPTVRDGDEAAAAAAGGPKLVAVDLATDVHYPDSYMNNLRFDLRPGATASGAGVAYVVDSSNEGRTGFIVVDLGAGESWRRLDRHPSTSRVAEDVPSYDGIPSYFRQRGRPLGFQPEGLDGAEMHQCGEVMHYSALTTDYLYSIETKYLRTNPATNPLANKLAEDNMKNLGQRGGNANGFAGDSLGNVYMLMPEHNAIYIYNYTTHLAMPYVRDPRIIWPDSANVGWDGYIYFNINQLPYQADWNNGVEGRAYPVLILVAKMPDGAVKNTLLM